MVADGVSNGGVASVTRRGKHRVRGDGLCDCVRPTAAAAVAANAARARAHRDRADRDAKDDGEAELKQAIEDFKKVFAQ